MFLQGFKGLQSHRIIIQYEYNCHVAIANYMLKYFHELDCNIDTISKTLRKRTLFNVSVTTANLVRE